MNQTRLSPKFANAFECYEAIGRRLAEEAPEPWERIEIEFTILEIDDVSEQVIRYVPSRRMSKRYRQFFIRDPDFQECFFALARLTSTPEKHFFRKCRFVLSGSGKYKVDFDY
jgi:hypothetical protein